MTLSTITNAAKMTIQIVIQVSHFNYHTQNGIEEFFIITINFTLEIINNSDTIEIEKHVRFPGVRSEIDIRERTTRGIKLCVSAESGEDPSGSSQVLVALKAC